MWHVDSPDHSPRSLLEGIALAVFVVGAVTAVLYPISDLDPGVSSGVLYVLGVLIVATRHGLRLGLFTAVLSALALDWFHTAPVHSLWSGKDVGDMVAVVNVVLTAIVASVIADWARRRAVESEERRVRLREVRESRTRVLDAADEERRRVVRDLHDGAQQRLVHTVVNLKIAEQLMDTDEATARKMIGEALVNAQLATNELRELAHGILPSVLTHGGLRGAVDALATRMPVPVEADISDDRYPGPVEATAYFVIAEALTNAAKHAQADGVWVSVRTDGAGALHVEVRDDGVGGAFTGGSGMLGLIDRVEAAQGTIDVLSPAGAGTTMRARIPVPVA
jgi:signal transduction histidine kinase